MSLTRTKSKQKVKQTRTPITWKEIKRQKVLLFWAGVMMIYGVIFYYLPLAGWAMAFQNYKPQLGNPALRIRGTSEVSDVILGCDIPSGHS